MADNANIRINCLKLAVEMRQVGNTAEAIVANAEVFETFVTSEKNVITPRRKRAIKKDKL